MFEHLQRLLRDERKPETSPEDEQRLAAAVLLIEVARADFDGHHPAERSVLRASLSRDFGVSDAALDGLLEKAELRAKQSVSLFDFVQTLNRTMTADAKRGLLKRLWEVAHADGRIDPHEEALLRRIADMLYLSHADFIRGKLEAEKPDPSLREG